jgi:hypothetical protein
LGDHRFKVGQSVKYSHGVGGLRRPSGSGGIYKIIQLLPAEGDEWLYRVKSADEPHEHVAKEAELYLTTAIKLGYLRHDADNTAIKRAKRPLACIFAANGLLRHARASPSQDLTRLRPAALPTSKG